jgi:hypothetical protein
MANAAPADADHSYLAALSLTSADVPLSQLPGDHQVSETNSGEAAPTTQDRNADTPDGGYGWVVVAACAVLTFWFVGTTYSWGIIQGALVHEGLAQPSTLSFVGALTVSCISFLAIVNAKLIGLVGPRRCALLGVLLIGLGEILSGFSTDSVAGLFATIGVIMGIGTRFALHLPMHSSKLTLDVAYAL